MIHLHTNTPPATTGHYTLFGEVVKGMDVAMAINKLASQSGQPTGNATIVGAGQLPKR